MFLLTKVFFILYAIVSSLIFGFITLYMNRKKGYSGGFAWGLFLRIIGIIVVAVRPYKMNPNGSNERTPADDKENKVNTPAAQSATVAQVAVKQQRTKIRSDEFRDWVEEWPLYVREWAIYKNEDSFTLEVKVLAKASNDIKYSEWRIRCKDIAGRDIAGLDGYVLKNESQYYVNRTVTLVLESTELMDVRTIEFLLSLTVNNDGKTITYEGLPVTRKTIPDRVAISLGTNAEQKDFYKARVSGSPEYYYAEKNGLMVCPYCGVISDSGNEVCPDCGHDRKQFEDLTQTTLNEAFMKWKKEQERIAREKSLQQEEENRRMQIEAQKKAEAEAKARKRKTIVVILILVIIAVICSAVYIFVIKPERDKRAALEAYEALVNEEDRIAAFSTVAEWVELPTVTFYDGDKIVASDKLYPGSQVVFPKLEEKDGRHCLGWVIESGSDIITEMTMPTYDCKFHTVYGFYVTFVDFEGGVLAKDLIVEGEKYKLRSIRDEKLGVAVSSWRNTTTGDVVSVSPRKTEEYSVESDIEYTAVYNLTTRFMYQNGIIQSSVSNDYGEYVDVPAFQKDSGFIGLSTSPDMNAEILASDRIKVEGDATYYLRFDNRIAFSSDGAVTSSLPASFEVESGYKYKLPALSDSSTKAFMGWQIEDSIHYAGEEIEIKGDTELKALFSNVKWQGTASDSYLSCYVDNTTNKIVNKTDSLDKLKDYTEYRTSTSYFKITNGEITLTSEGKKVVIEYLTIPEVVNSVKITSIGYGAFGNCTNLKDVNLPEGVLEIAPAAFRDCKNLKNVNIPSSVTTIGSSAFSGSGAVFGSLDLTNVTMVDGWAFRECTIKKLIISDKTKLKSNWYSDDFPFFKVQGLTELVMAEGSKAVNNILSASMRESLEKVTLPEGLTEIKDEAFKDCKKLKSIEIPSTVTTIGANAFYGCKSLKDVSIPSSVTTIGASAFSSSGAVFGNLDLTNVKTVGSGAFYGCTANKLVVNDNVKNYNSNLNDIQVLTELVVAEGTEVMYNILGNSMRETLENVTLPESLTEIMGGAFSNCKNLKNVNIPSSVTTIGSSAFSGSGAVFGSLDLTNVTMVDGWAFRECTIKKLIISDKTKLKSNWYSDDFPFFKVQGLTELVMAEGSKAVNNILSASMRESLEKVTLPEGLTEIKDEAFKDCKKLKSIEIPSTVTTIGANAFYGCKSLKDVSIPSSVTTIGASAFSSSGAVFGNLDLTNVKTVGSGAFYGCTANKLVVNDNVKNYSSGRWKNGFKVSEELHVPKDSSYNFSSLFPGVKIVKY